LSVLRGNLAMFKNQKKNNRDILIVTDNGLETVGGEQESTKIIINGIKNQFKLGVIQPGVVKNKAENVTYYDMTKKTRIKHLIKNPFAFLKYIWKVREIIKREKPRIIHTQAQVSFFIVALLKKLRLVPNNFTLIHTERGLYIVYNRFFKRLFYSFMKELDTLVTTTNYNMKHWKKALESKGYDLNYKVIENTAGNLFEKNYTVKDDLKKDESNLVIGFAGRYSEQKNWPLAVEIVKKLNKELGEKIHVKMAVGCLDDKSEVATNQMFKKLSDLLGTRFDGKINVSLEMMDKFYQSIDIYILTSLPKSESFGRTLIEAMYRQTVVLTTDAGGPEEIVRSKASVCKTSDEFIKKILLFYFEPTLIEKEKDLNFKEVRNRYSLENNIKKHMALYSDLLF